MVIMTVDNIKCSCSQLSEQTGGDIIGIAGSKGFEPLNRDPVNNLFSLKFPGRVSCKNGNVMFSCQSFAHRTHMCLQTAYVGKIKRAYLKDSNFSSPNLIILLSIINYYRSTEIIISTSGNLQPS